MNTRNETLAKLVASKGRNMKITKRVRHFTEQSAHDWALVTTEATLAGVWLSPEDAENIARHIDQERKNSNDEK